MENLLLFFFSRRSRTEGQVGGLALHGKRQMNPVTLVWSLRRGSSSALGQRGCRDGVFYKWVPLAVVLVCLLRFSVTITPNVMCSACAICHTFSVFNLRGGFSWQRMDSHWRWHWSFATAPLLSEKSVLLVKGVTGMVTGSLIPQWRKCHFPLSVWALESDALGWRRWHWLARSGGDCRGLRRMAVALCD